MPRFALAAIPLLAACALSPSAQLRPDEPIPAGEALAFGRIEVAIGDQAAGPTGQAYDKSYWRVLLALIRENEAEATTHEVGEGSFRWHLAPGRYLITAWAGQERGLLGPENRWASGQVGVAFDVDVAGSASYLGTLQLRIDRAGTRIVVRDDLEAERAAPGRMPPGAPVRKALLRPIDQGPVADPALAGGSSEGYWTNLRGVNPIFPAPTRGEVNELQPTLRWEPLAGTDHSQVTYDLRLSRTVRVGDRLWGWVHTVGPEIYRRERLASPSHRLELPLEWDRTYYWEVRLRRGESVGPWSRHDGFIPIARVTLRNVPFMFTVSRPAPQSDSGM